MDSLGTRYWCDEAECQLCCGTNELRNSIARKTDVQFIKLLWSLKLDQKLLPIWVKQMLPVPDKRKRVSQSTQKHQSLLKTLKPSRWWSWASAETEGMEAEGYKVNVQHLSRKMWKRCKKQTKPAHGTLHKMDLCQQRKCYLMWQDIDKCAVTRTNHYQRHHAQSGGVNACTVMETTTARSNMEKT